MNRHCLHFVALSLFSLCPSIQAKDWTETVTPFAQPLIDDKDCVGLVIGIVDGSRSQVLPFGETTKGSGNAPNEKTMYEIGSISKVFTGILLADAVSRGKLQLSDPVQRCLPDSVVVPLNQDQPITLLHLATHTSGLPRLPSNIKPADMSNPYVDYDADKAYEFLNGFKPKKPLGNYEYSNFAAGLLGHALASFQKKSYEELLAERITEPLEMSDTRLELSQDQQKRLAPPYDAALEKNHTWEFQVLAGAGGIRSSVSDMMRFIRAHFPQEQTTELSATLQWARQSYKETPTGMIGLAWQLSKDSSVCEHNGMTGGYHSYVAIDVSKNLGVVILANTASMKVTRLGRQVIRLLGGEQLTPPKPQKMVEVDPKVLEKYTGFYAATPEFGMTIRLEDGQLSVQATGQQKFPLFAEANDKFFLKVVEAKISFIAKEDGSVDQLILHQGGREIKATRKK